MSIDLMAPNGLPIVGTAEEAIGYAGLSSLRRDGNGVVLHTHNGTTEGFYDTQFTVEMGAERLFEDGDGNWWRESRLVDVGSIIPDPVPQPDVWCGNQPTMAEALRDQKRVAAIPAEAIAAALKWADAFFEQSADDEDVSAEEQAERDAGTAAVDAVRAWLASR